MFRLKNILQRNLYDSRVLSTEDPAEVSRRTQGCAGIVEAHAIQDVEGFATKLYMLAFADAELPCHRSVELPEIGADNIQSTEIAVGAQSRLREGCGVQPVHT